jgi:hypothetical protein
MPASAGPGLIHRLDRALGAGPDRIGRARLDALLDRRKRVIRIGQRRGQDQLDMRNLLALELVDLAQIGQALQQRTVGIGPIRRRIEAADDERA